MMNKNRSKSLRIFLSFLLTIVLFQEVVAVVPERPVTEVVALDNSRDDDHTSAIAIGDVNGDGHQDIVAGNAGVNKLYLNTGLKDAPFAGVVGLPITNDDDSTLSIALGDVDGDGDLDVVAGNYNFESESQNRLYLNNGTANPFNDVTGLNITDEDEDTSSIGLGDVDRDGDIDVVAAHPSFGTNRLYLNNGTENPFSNVTGKDITEDVATSNSVALGDMDGDGDLDVVVGNDETDFFGHANRLFLNNGTDDPFADITGSNITSDGDITISIALGDMDGDGSLDVVAGNTPMYDTEEDAQNQLYFNNGTDEPFADVSGITISNNPDELEEIVLGDVDGDGDLDVVAGYRGINRLYKNNRTASPLRNVNVVANDSK